MHEKKKRSVVSLSFSLETKILMHLDMGNGPPMESLTFQTGIKSAKQKF